MAEQPKQPAKPEIGITLLDGCIGWPVANGGLVRIDPFHIAAYGISPARDPGAEGPGATGWCVWVDVGNDSPYQVFYRDKRKAMEDFVVVQQAKIRH